MADVYFRIRHRPMAVILHNSVGAANGLTGVMNARIDSSAMIVITGAVWTRTEGRGAFQELSGDRDAGTPDIFRGSVKRAWHVNKAEKLPEILLKAYKEAVTGKPGPVLIDITQDAFAERIEVDLPDNLERWIPAYRTRGDETGARPPRRGQETCNPCRRWDTPVASDRLSRSFGGPTQHPRRDHRHGQRIVSR